jgi:predicted transcriptional regulator
MTAAENNPVLDAPEVKIKSKRIMAKFLLRYLSSETTRKILRLLGEGLSPSEVMEKVGFSKQRLQYWINIFLRDGLIYEFATGKPHIYELTAFGKKVLTTSERGVTEPLLMESYDVKFRLLQNNLKRDCSKCLEKCSIPKVGTTNNCVIVWEKLGDPKNWQKWGFKYCGVRIERNDGLFPTVVIRTGEISGFDPYEIVAEAGTVIALVRAKLKDLGLLLDDVGAPLHEPLFHTYTQEAEILNKQGVVYTSGGHIDDSPLRNPAEQGTRVPHEERNFAQQVDYMGLPALVRELEQKIDSLRKENTEIKDSMVSYVKATTKFVSEVTRKQEETTKQFTDAMQQFTNYLQEVSVPKVQGSKRLYE